MNVATPSRDRARRFALFDYGFRPFFLLAGGFALLAVPAWFLLYRAGLMPLRGMPGQLWHGHEMLFGFVGAAIAGFMLTAVPSWTGSRGFAGLPLALLVTVWVAGRAAFAFAAQLPLLVVAAAELAFIPVLLVLVAPPVLRTMNRNVPILVVLTVIWCLDAAFLWALAHQDILLAQRVLLVTLGVVLLLITIIGGRIVPAFTGNALRARGLDVGLRHRPWIERFLILAMASLVAADLLRAPVAVVAAVAGAAALLHAIRVGGWQTRHTLRDPIVWILHAAYAWLPIGLGLRAVFLLTSHPLSVHWMHALGSGAAATMILAVMTRASLGHTGRPLLVSRLTAVSYGLLLAATAIRVIGPAVLPGAYTAIVAIASAAWAAAFALFVWVYTPILCGPRADGRPG